MNYRVIYFIFLLLLITTVGTVGYMWLEHWSLSDSLYMTIITISTVGFGEINELSQVGRLFTTVLIVGSFGIFALAIGSLTKYIVGGEYKEHLKEYKLMKATSELKNHVIICGFGRVGRQVAKDLMHSEIPFVIIDQNKEHIDDSKRQFDFLFLHGNSTNDEILEKAGILRAKAIITCLPNDADNLYVVLSARESNSNILIVSRASQESAVSKLKIAGANNVIMPDSIGGAHMASLVSNPDVMEFVDLLKSPGFEGATVSSLTFEELSNGQTSLNIGEIRSKSIGKLSIIGLKNSNGEYLINPDDELNLNPNERIFVLGSSKQLNDKLSALPLLK